MNLQDAAHRIGHEYPGGAGALADRMGINRAVFNSKINPNTATHHLTMVECFRMQQLAGRNDVLFAMAEGLGFVCLPMPSETHADIHKEIGRVCQEFGQYVAEVTAAIEDGRITGNELKACEKELADLVGAANTLQATLGMMRHAAIPQASSPTPR